MPFVPGAEFSYLPFRFFAVPAVMLLEFRRQNLGLALDLDNFFSGQSPPTLLDPLSNLTEVVLTRVHVFTSRNSTLPSRATYGRSGKFPSAEKIKLYAEAGRV